MIGVIIRASNHSNTQNQQSKQARLRSQASLTTLKEAPELTQPHPISRWSTRTSARYEGWRQSMLTPHDSAQLVDLLFLAIVDSQVSETTIARHALREVFMANVGESVPSC